MSDHGLTRVSLADLEALLAHVKSGRVRCPLEETGLAAHGLRHVESQAALLAGLDQAAVVAALSATIGERRHRPVPIVELVWTGPETRVAEARDTAVVVKHLFRDAQRSVLMGGYSFDHGADIFAPLHETMRTRGVSTTLVLDIPGHAARESEAEAFAADAIERFFAKNWPFGDPKPDVYYDPRTVLPKNWVSLHAKCVVVDARVTLVTSANFTDRGHTRNIEAGVLVDDPSFASRFTAQWRGLIETGLAKRYAG